MDDLTKEHDLEETERASGFVTPESSPREHVIDLELSLGGELEELAESSPEDPLVKLDLGAQIGSLLFVSPRPITVDKLAELTGASTDEVQEALVTFRSLLNEVIFGFLLQEVAGGWQMRTSPYAARIIQKLIPPKSRKLSRAAAETLAVIAYKQPVQRAEIEAIRGVDALPTLKTLLDAKLVRIVGREDSAGQPSLYGTTGYFLEKFGLRDLSELPTVRELMQLANEPGEVEGVMEEERDPSSDDQTVDQA